MWKHDFIDKDGKRRCAVCGLEFDPTDNPEIVAAFEMSGCPEGTFNPRRAVSVTASIGLDCPWIQYAANSSKDDPFYYRDFVDQKGNLCYCDGESCLAHPWLHPEKHPDTVLMSNEESTIPYFIISREQFIADFGKEALTKLYTPVEGRERSFLCV